MRADELGGRCRGDLRAAGDVLEHPRHPVHDILSEAEAQDEVPPALGSLRIAEPADRLQPLATDRERSVEVVRREQRLGRELGTEARRVDPAAVSEQVIVPMDEVNCWVVPSVSGDLVQQVGLEAIAGEYDEHEVPRPSICDQRRQGR